jgi:hypothetical protein
MWRKDGECGRGGIETRCVPSESPDPAPRAAVLLLLTFHAQFPNRCYPGEITYSLLVNGRVRHVSFVLIEQYPKRAGSYGKVRTHCLPSKFAHWIRCVPLLRFLAQVELTLHRDITASTGIRLTPVLL